MPTRDINCEIIEELYSQALVLADDARTVFDLRRTDTAVQPDDLTRVALSIEGLRTTTRLMPIAPANCLQASWPAAGGCPTSPLQMRTISRC